MNLRKALNAMTNVRNAKSVVLPTLAFLMCSTVAVHAQDQAEDGSTSGTDQNLVSTVVGRGAATLGSRSNDDSCSSIWITTAGTRSRYWNMFAAIRGRVNLTVVTHTFLGSPTSQESCYRKWYFNAKIVHGGRVTNILGKTMIEFSEEKNNESYFRTSKNNTVHGADAFPALRRDTRHAAFTKFGAVIQTSTRSDYF